MAKLTKSQKEFLTSIGLEVEETIDASGMSRAAYQKIMREKGLKIAYGVTPCSREGHTLRTRAGHCAQCNPLAVVYLKRNDVSGFLYIAQSDSKKIVKVGITSNINERKKSLRIQGYGGAYDWQIKFSEQLDVAAGAIEKEIQARLKAHRVPTTYWKDYKEQQATETFNCSFDVAYSVVQKVLKTK